MSRTVVTVEHCDIKTTIEQDVELCANVVDMALKAVVSVGFQQETVDDIVVELADMIQMRREPKEAK